MAGDSKKLQPIIIKRIKKSGHAAHGGAWKIAYADYFQSPLKIAMSGGSGSGDSNSVLKGGGESLTSTVGQVKKGDVEAQRNTINLHKLKAEQVRAEISRLEDLKQEIQ